MYCKKCGYKLDNNAQKCPFCNEPVGNTYVEENPVIKETVVFKKEAYPEYRNITKQEETASYRDKLGYVNLKINGWLHALVGCVGYILMNVLFTFVGAALVASLKNQGVDFSCALGEEGLSACPIEVQVAYTKAAATGQVICELLVVGIVALIFMKFLKYFSKEFKDKKTYKWFGIGFGLMYGANVAYNILLQILNVTSSSANQDAVNKVVLQNPVLGFLFVVVAAPLFEEIVFRLGIFRAFTKRGKKMEFVGVIVTTIAFALIHMVASVEAVFADPANPDWSILLSDLSSLPSYLIGAFFLTFAYYKSKNFLTPILMHMAWNFIGFIGIIGLGALEGLESSTSQAIIELLTRLF